MCPNKSSADAEPEQEEEPVKKKRNTGGAIKKACDSFNCEQTQLRYSTVSVSLKRLLKKKSKALLYVLRDISSTTGVMQHVASLVVNSALTKDPSMLSEYKNIKTIYDQAMSAVGDALGLRIRASSHENKMLECATELVSQHLSKEQIESLNLKPIPFDLRQQCALEMATATKQHLKQLRQRMQCMFRVKVYGYAKGICAITAMQRGILNRMTLELVNATISTPGQLLNQYSSKLQELVGQLGLAEDDTSAMVTCIYQWINDERTFLGSLVTEIVETTSQNRKRKRTESSNDDTVYVQSKMSWMMDRDKEVPKLLFYFQRISNTILEHNDRLRRETEESGPSKRELDKASTFTLVPIFKLRPSHVLYTSTETDVLCKFLMKKGGTGESLDLPTFSKVDISSFFNQMFDLKCVKGKWNPERWHPVCFRTNGTQVDLTFVSGTVEAALNSSCLLEAGYEIPFPVDSMIPLTDSHLHICNKS